MAIAVKSSRALKAERIADGHYDFPGPKGEWLETDLRARARAISLIDGDVFEGCCDLDNVSVERSTTSMRNSLAPRFDPMTALRTNGQRQRFCRNLAIAAGHKYGLSQRQLGMVFDLPHSRIGDVLKEMETLCSS